MAHDEPVRAPQLKYISDLAVKKELGSLNDEQRAFLVDYDRMAATLTKRKASEIIDLLKQLPWLPRPATAPPVVPLEQGAPPTADKPNLEGHVAKQTGPTKSDVEAARYYIVDPTTGKESFFKVDKPGWPSKWAGYTFVSTQASDDFYPIKDAARRDAILVEIAKDPVTAMNEYGIRLGQCGKCGRTLTNRDSRLRGLGPICANNVLGYELEATSEEKNLLDQLGLIK